MTVYRSSIYIINLDNVLPKMKEIDYIADADDIVVGHTLSICPNGVIKITSIFSERTDNN